MGGERGDGRERGGVGQLLSDPAGKPLVDTHRRNAALLTISHPSNAEHRSAVK